MGIKEGLLTMSLLAKRFSNDGGTMSEAESLQKLIDIMWDYISESDIPEISKRLEEEE